MLRIGFLTSGGDCQALNAAMRGVFKCIVNNAKEPVEFYGFEDGYKGLIYGKFRILTGQDFKGILTRGGTILGTSRVPFKTIREPDENGIDKVAAMKQTYHKLQLDCLVMGGGNGSHKTANLLSEEGLNVVTLPKTIDNDLWGTDMTFGFQSAIDIATKCIDDIHTTASSHGRVFIVEIMGHKVGWLPLNAGIAGGADIILIPEIPYDINKVVEAIEERDKGGSRFTIIVVAEGAAAASRSSLSRKARSPKRTPSSPRKNIRRNSLIINILPFPTRSRTRSQRQQAAKSASLFPDTHSAAELRIPMTAYSRPGSVRKPAS